MFPIRITTLVTEEVYKRFSWAILIRRKSFIAYLIVILGLILYLMIVTTGGQDIFFFCAIYNFCFITGTFLELKISYKAVLSKKSFMAEYGDYSDIR